MTIRAIADGSIAEPCKRAAPTGGAVTKSAKAREGSYGRDAPAAIPQRVPHHRLQCPSIRAEHRVDQRGGELGDAVVEHPVDRVAIGR